MATRATRVPQAAFESAGNRARSVGGSGPGGGGFNPTIATDIGAGAGALMEAVQKINIERDSVSSVKAETEHVTKAEKAMAELDPLAPDYNDRVKQVWADARQAALDTSGITTSAVKDDLDRRMTRHGAGAEITAVKVRKDAVGKETELAAWDSVNATSAKIRNDPANGNAYMAQFQQDMERLKVGMDPVRLGAFSRKAADDMAKNQIIGYAEKGQYGAARAAMKEQAEHLDTGVVTGLSNYIDGKEAKARADGERYKTQQAATLLVDLDDQFSGNKPIDPNNRQRIDQMKDKGILSPEGYLTAVRTLNNEQAKYNKSQAEAADALAAFQTGTLSGQKQADKVYDALGFKDTGRIALQGTPEERAALIKATTGVAGQTGLLPGQFKNLLENSDKITDPAKAGLVGFAAEAADDLENTIPRSLANAKLDNTGTLAIVRAEAKRLMDQGIPKSDAYQQAAKAHMSKGPLTIQEEKDRADVTKQDLSKMDVAGKVTAAMTTFGERNIPFVTLPGVDVAMQGEWKRQYESAFGKTGNKEQAEAVANNALKNTYGTTLVGAVGKKAPPAEGTPESAAMNPLPMDPAGARAQVVRRPIERYLPPSMKALEPAEQALILQNQIEAGIKQAGVSLIKDPTFPQLASYRLTADNRTEQDLRDGRPPTYVVQVLRNGSDGQYETVPGLPRFAPPTEDNVKLDPTFTDINNARLQKQLSERDAYLKNQTEIRTRPERDNRNAPRPSQVPQPLIDRRK